MIITRGYVYKIVTKENKILEGSLFAFSKRRAAKNLRREGATVIWVTKENGNVLGQDILSLFSSGFSKVDRILFFRNFSSMLGVGLSIVEALKVLEEQAKSRKAKKIIVSLATDVRNGQKLSAAMSKFPKNFAPYLVEIINVGEHSGELSDSLDNISKNLERDYEISRKVVSAMMYPLIVLSLMFVVVGVLLIYVLPQIVSLYSELDVSLPLPTLILFKISFYLNSYPFHIAGFLFGIATSIYLALRTKRGKYFFHYLILRIPYFGELIKEFNLVRFFRSLSSLFSSGISLFISMKIVKKTVKNSVYARAIESTEVMLVHGIPLTDAIRPFPALFPSQARYMLEVGEKAGKFESTFKQLIVHYERSIDYRIQMLNSFLEPILIIAVGLMVGVLALSIFLPIYQVSTAF